MTEVKITVNRATATAKMSGTLTSGMVGVKVDFSYSDVWNGLSKTAVFTAGKVTRDVLNADGTVEVPPEVLQKPGEKLYVGVYGTNKDGTLVIPTVRAYVGSIIQGSDPSGDESTRPELPVWAQHEVRIKKLEEEGAGGNGKPGFSPTVSVEEIEGGNRITITDVDGEKTVDVMDGKDGTPGADGKPGADGLDGKDGVITLTGAKVGDIARVAAVDENGVPTAWEPVDMPSGGEEWVQLAEVITTENVNFIFVSFDACKAVKGYFVYGAVESDLGRIGILPNVFNPAPYMITEMRHAIFEFVTSSTNKRGVVSFDIDTRDTVVWQSTCSAHRRSDGEYETDITNVLIPGNIEIGTSNVQRSIMTDIYMDSKKVEDGVLSICVYGAGMVKGTKLFLWGLKK